MSKILARIYGKKRGWCFSPKDFSDLGTPSFIWQTLSRLEKQGTIRKVLRGVYDYPEHSAILDGPASPNHEKIAQALARNHGWTIVPDGNTAMNILGLSTQVPANWCYFTDGPSKTYDWKGGHLQFKKRAMKEVDGLSFTSAVLVQGLKAFGKENLTEEALTNLKNRLPHETLKVALKECQYSTAWVYEVLKNLAQGGSSDE